MDETLAGAKLTPLQALEVSGAFARGDIPNTSSRQMTPPPGSASELDALPELAGTSHSNPWIIDSDDLVQANTNTKKSCK